MKKPTRWISQAIPAILLAAILFFGAFGVAQKTKTWQQKKTSPLKSCKKTNLPKVCESLVHLYQSNDIPFVIQNKNVCSWNEVRCNDKRNQVIKLHLADKHLKVLPAGIFAGLSSLQFLDSDDNALKTLPAGIFAGLSSLQGLSLSGNGLKTLPAGVFAGLSSLQVLYLFSNGLQTLPEGVFAGLSSLQVLSLSDNQLQTLPVGVFAGLFSLKFLSLTENPLPTSFKLSQMLCTQASIFPQTLCPSSR